MPPWLSNSPKIVLLLNKDGMGDGVDQIHRKQAKKLHSTLFD